MRRENYWSQVPERMERRRGWDPCSNGEVKLKQELMVL
jgi:hypothetical protein